jgi:deoxyribonuclease V
MMVKGIDLHDALHSLVDQIPEGMVSTPLDLAVALGDPIAARSVTEMIGKDEFKDSRHKVTSGSQEGRDVFTEFKSDEPLKVLAQIQHKMAERVIQEDCFDEINRFAGVDAAYRDDKAGAACVVMDSGLKIVDSASASAHVRFPYVSGYLMFREAPVIEAAARQASGYDVLFVNGHGVAHPRGCGLASCVGLDLDVPTIGVARRRLVGDVGDKRGGWAPLIFDDEVVGAEVEMDGSRVYVSVGHKMSLETSVKMVRRMTSDGRFPEPLRRAHTLAERIA